MITMRDLLHVANIAVNAGLAILDVPCGTDVKMKRDNSPVTIADRLSNEIIFDELSFLFPGMAIVSEEIDEKPIADQCWVVDPLDGTKEFIKGSPEYTVNIGLIEGGKSVAGVVVMPAIGVVQYGGLGIGAYTIVNGKTIQLINSQHKPTTVAKVAVSRSHRSKKVNKYINELKEKYPKVKTYKAGSSIKFCQIANKTAHIYPRFGTTMEWDTAAAQALVEATGGCVIDQETAQPMRYGKPGCKNNHFIAYSWSNHENN